MAAPQNFRSAFNGFNREDVVRYIEYLNARQAAQLNQLGSENEFLRQKLEQTSAQAAGNPAQAELEEKLSLALSRIAELENCCAALEQERDAVRVELEEAKSERDTAVADQAAVRQQQTMQQTRMEEELEAYRRAERAERVAKERADQLYRKANGVLTEVTARVDAASGDVAAMADQVIAQLEAMKSSVSGSKLALQEASATLYTIRPADAEV